MGIYFIKRHVVYMTKCQQTEEVWGIDRPALNLPTMSAPRITDADDPLRSDSCSVTLLKMPDGSYVTWNKIGAYLSIAESAGYTIVSEFKNLSPYSVIVLSGP